MIILGLNPEAYQTEWQQAVGAVQTLNKNVLFIDSSFLWKGATQDLYLNLVGTPAPDYAIHGTPPIGFAAALALMTKFNGATTTKQQFTAFDGTVWPAGSSYQAIVANYFTWNNTNTQLHGDADTAALALYAGLFFRLQSTQNGFPFVTKA
jgi:hypothetical protein